MSIARDHFSALQSKGDRSYQEDEFGILNEPDSASRLREQLLLIVADGMGGHVAGAKASQIVTESFIDTYRQSKGSILERLRKSLHHSNINIAEAARDPKRNALRSAVMGEKLRMIDNSTDAVQLQQGDVILLATDGVMTLSDTQIEKIIRGKYGATNEEILASILQAATARNNPNQDNTTILIYSIG